MYQVKQAMLQRTHKERVVTRERPCRYKSTNLVLQVPSLLVVSFIHLKYYARIAFLLYSRSSMLVHIDVTAMFSVTKCKQSCLIDH